MAQALIRKLKDDTLNAYKAAAKRNGRSLEAELRELIEQNRPVPSKDREALGALSRRLRAMTPEGATMDDSTLWIRWDRDTDHGRSVDDGWADDTGR